jgi:hypothetical protein
MRKFWFFSALASAPLLCFSCSKQEAVVHEPPATAVAAAASDGAAAAVTIAAPKEVEVVAEPAVEEESSGSLRDRFEITEAPPVEDRPWSNAVTLEERMANLKKSMASGTEPFVVDMHDFGGWEFDEGKKQPFPAHVLALEGKNFTIRGFMMPDIDFEHIRQFHLVRSLFSCCFGAPPQLNEILRVSLQDENGMEYTYNTVEVTGTLRVVFEMEDGLVEDLFRLENATYRIIDFDDPVAPTSFDAATGFGDLLPTKDSEY